VEGETFEFRPGENLRLFSLYRYTPEKAHALLGEHGMAVLDHWVSKSGEEGVFLRRKNSP
jgi:Histidine-specific methyltransferase, SAM-dependent